MIRKLLACAVVALCVGVIATSAFAIEIVNPRNGHGGPTVHAVVPPGNTTFATVRTVLQWAFGNQRIKVFTTDSCVNGQRVFTANSIWLNHFTGEITIQQDRSVVIGTCP